MNETLMGVPLSTLLSERRQGPRLAWGEKKARALKVGVNTCALVLTSEGVMSA
jgi:hypothetical protein